MVTESYLEFTGADIAFENAGGIRAGLEAGEITYQDVISISPYGNIVITKKLTGKEIIDILNKSMAIGKACDDVYTIQKEAVEKGEDPYQYSWPENSGSYLQYSGIEIEINENGQIISAKINGTEINENQTYTVAMNNYLGESDVYTALAEAGLEQEFGTCEQALLKYIQNNMSTEDALTRGDAAEMLIAAVSTYQPNIQKSDIIKGYEDGLLHEDMKATKLEALVMLKRAFGTLPNSSSSISIDAFTDIPEWAKSEMTEVLQSGIVEGTSDGLFYPNETINAEQMEMYINQVLELFETTGSSEAM